MKHFLVLLLLLSSIMFSGCEQIDETTDSQTNESFVPNEANTCDQSDENTLGCFGDDMRFGDNSLLTEGTWSIYAKRDDNINYYDTYLYSYEFSNQGYVAFIDKVQESVMEWGINRDGTKITINPDGVITYKSIFTSDECYEISHSAYSETLKMCPDALVDTTNENEFGYYSKSIKFGNYQYGDYTAVGTWTVSNYGTSTTVDIHTLNSDGSTVDGGNWGINKNGKILLVNSSSYLISKYLSNDCLLCFDLQGSMLDPLQLCKQ
ncbi:MAG: hypothetical protein U9P71_02195 [Campylobacterota bacterium]|nr:hypothetical protein [Campylobacterota bacterium]